VNDDITVAARRLMSEEYVRFTTLGGAKRAVREVILVLIGERPLVTHCFAGKDRTGFTVATVLEATGVDRDAITADFLRSNAAMPQLRERMKLLLEGSGNRPEGMAGEHPLLNNEVLGVREGYLADARRSIDNNYGSLRGYLESAGVTGRLTARLPRVGGCNGRRNRAVARGTRLIAAAKSVSGMP
jgi:protein-tyrosine phosphatase